MQFHSIFTQTQWVTHMCLYGRYMIYRMFDAPKLNPKIPWCVCVCMCECVVLWLIPWTCNSTPGQNEVGESAGKYSAWLTDKTTITKAHYVFKYGSEKCSITFALGLLVCMCVCVCHSVFVALFPSSVHISPFGFRSFLANRAHSSIRIQ